MGLVSPRSKPKPSGNVIPFDPVGWKERFEERRAILEHDGELTEFGAASQAGREATLDWMTQNLPHAYSVIRCAHCDEIMDHDRVSVRATMAGAFVHTRCLVEFVAAWRGRAVAAMHEAGFPRQAQAAAPSAPHPLDVALDRSIDSFKRRHHCKPMDALNRWELLDLKRWMQKRAERSPAALSDKGQG